MRFSPLSGAAWLTGKFVQVDSGDESTGSPAILWPVGVN